MEAETILCFDNNYQRENHRIATQNVGPLVLVQDSQGLFPETGPGISGRQRREIYDGDGSFGTLWNGKHNNVLILKLPRRVMIVGFADDSS